MTLIEKIKPEILEALENDAKINFNSSYEAIVLSLSEPVT